MNTRYLSDSENIAASLPVDIGHHHGADRAVGARHKGVVVAQISHPKCPLLV